MMPNPITPVPEKKLKGLSAEDFDDIKRQADLLFTQYDPLKKLFVEYEDIYFMENKDKQPGDMDPTDWLPTVSPTASNAVTGMTRLLKTAVPQFTVEGSASSKIEERLKCFIAESNKAARTQDDAVLSAVLYGPVALMVDKIDAILSVKSLPKYQRARLTTIRKKTPFLYRVIPQSESYPDFGEYGGLRAHFRRYETTVRDVRERWGDDVLPGKKPTEKVIIRDWYDYENRAVWHEGSAVPITSGKHGLGFIPIVCNLTGGSNLFTKPERQIKSFLYPTLKAGLHKRETLVYSTLFSSMFLRGPGPLLSIDPEGLANNGDQLVINHNAGGGVRYILGKATPINDKGTESDLYNAKKLLDELNGQSTIHGQSLGEGVGANVPFSSLITMAQTGRLPLVDPATSIATAFAEASKIALAWIKLDGIEDEIKPSDITDDLDITCKMEPDLPQDQARNAGIAGQVKGLASTEWIRGNLLGITDSDGETKKIWTEQASEQLYQEIARLTLPEILKFIMPQQPGGDPNQTPPTDPQGQPTPEQMAQMQQQQGQAMSPDGSATMPTTAGAPVQPMTDPRMPGGL